MLSEPTNDINLSNVVNLRHLMWAGSRFWPTTLLLKSQYSGGRIKVYILTQWPDQGNICHSTIFVFLLPHYLRGCVYVAKPEGKWCVCVWMMNTCVTLLCGFRFSGLHRGSSFFTAGGNDQGFLFQSYVRWCTGKQCRHRTGTVNTVCVCVFATTLWGITHLVTGVLSMSSEFVEMYKM